MWSFKWGGESGDTSTVTRFRSSSVTGSRENGDPVSVWKLGTYWVLLATACPHLIRTFHTDTALHTVRVLSFQFLPVVTRGVTAKKSVLRLQKDFFPFSKIIEKLSFDSSCDEFLILAGFVFWKSSLNLCIARTGPAGETLQHIFWKFSAPQSLDTSPEFTMDNMSSVLAAKLAFYQLLLPTEKEIAALASRFPKYFLQIKQPTHHFLFAAPRTCPVHLNEWLRDVFELVKKNKKKGWRVISLSCALKAVSLDKHKHSIVGGGGGGGGVFTIRLLGLSSSCHGHMHSSSRIRASAWIPKM